MRVTSWIRQTVIGPILHRLRPLLLFSAYCWRRLMVRTCVIAVTGSLGKTTSKEAIASILRTKYVTFKSVRNQNARILVALNLLRIRPWHRFAVLELASDRAGVLSRTGKLVKPDIAVVTCISETHTRNYRSLDETSREKLALLHGLRRGGHALLNGADSRLRKVEASGDYGISFYGDKQNSILWADNVKSVWPGRLCFDACTPAQRISVTTQFVGTHQLGPALAALAVSVHCGLKLEEAAAALKEVPPFAARMEPVRVPSGAVFLRDEYNGSRESTMAALNAFEGVQAARRIVILTDFTDSKEKPRRRFRRLGEAAARIADIAIFLGDSGHHGKTAAMAAGMKTENTFWFTSLEEAALHLSETLAAGDLVLLKGRTTDHVSRLFWAQVGTVRCWDYPCGKTFLCDICWKLGLSNRDMARAVKVLP